MDALPTNMPSGNGCDFWPDGLGSLDWRICCDAHDFAYGIGGNAWERLQTDWALAVCVNEIAPGMGFVMLVGVVGAGWLFWTWRKRRAS